MADGFDFNQMMMLNASRMPAMGGSESDAKLSHLGNNLLLNLGNLQTAHVLQWDAKMMPQLADAKILNFGRGGNGSFGAGFLVDGFLKHCTAGWENIKGPSVEGTAIAGAEIGGGGGGSMFQEASLGEPMAPGPTPGGASVGASAVMEV